ncbi:hypothetical protein NMY22_g1928 [Coprinellus aureogranulatus]|nr:hypothetical protein NMY22_g1928 [Coprinellus aureogranulatus]
MKRHIDTDSEDDEDYVPPGHDDEGSGSDTGSEDGSGDEGVEPRAAAGPEVEEKKDLGKVWQDFQAAVTGQPTKAVPQEVKLVKVVRRYRFAGEEHEEVLEVHENSEEAKKWPRYQGLDDISTHSTECASPTSIVSTAATGTNSAAASKGISLAGSPGISPSSAASTSASSADRTVPLKRKPGPRKPKTTLAPLPGAASKAKKITTLEKSAMDWAKHVTRDDKDALEAQRRGGGGYLDKVEFLNRVEERKESVLSESASASKRRRL